MDPKQIICGKNAVLAALGCCTLVLLFSACGDKYTYKTKEEGLAAVCKPNPDPELITYLGFTNDQLQSLCNPPPYPVIKLGFPTTFRGFQVSTRPDDPRIEESLTRLIEGFREKESSWIAAGIQERKELERHVCINGALDTPFKLLRPILVTFGKNQFDTVVIRDASGIGNSCDGIPFALPAPDELKPLSMQTLFILVTQKSFQLAGHGALFPLIERTSDLQIALNHVDRTLEMIRHKLPYMIEVSIAVESSVPLEDIIALGKIALKNNFVVLMIAPYIPPAESQESQE
ncbi:MAG: hypothetical protein AB1405_08850 [Bdellovibrionota bacterium]